MIPSLEFGNLAPLLHLQLGWPERPLPNRLTALWHLQEDADAITRLLVRRLITQKEADKARRRLVRKIAIAVGPELVARARAAHELVVAADLREVET